MLGYVLAFSGSMGRVETIAVVVPISLVYAFVCLSSWYVCRVIPLGIAALPRALMAHFLAAAVTSLLWILLAKIVALSLSQIPALAQTDEHLAPHFPLLFGMGVLLYLLAVALHYVLLAIQASREAENREMEAGILARDAELKALKAQINPHFLFNSLHSISALTSVDATRAREMCIRLSDFLRSSLGLGEKESITLSEELSLTRSYLDVEQVRFGSRLTVEQDIEDSCRECLVPPLLLQPLVENAVKHGVATLLDGCVVRLEARRPAGNLSIMIENAFDPDGPPRQRNGLGLRNVKQRLQVRYGEAAAIEIDVEGNRYRVRLSLPAEAR